MNKRIKQIALLSLLGFMLGTATAWYQVNEELSAGNAVSRIEPAAGTSVAGSGIGGSLDLVDHNGSAVTAQDYEGFYKLVFFGFTYCPEICPAELQKMASALKALGPEAAKIQPLFISIDPQRDTPEVLKQYVELYDPRIIGLTGTPEQVKAAQKAYRVYAAKAEEEGPNGYMMNHSSYTFFIGPDGKLIELFTTGDKVSDMVKTIMQAL